MLQLFQLYGDNDTWYQQDEAALSLPSQLLGSTFTRFFQTDGQDAEYLLITPQDHSN
jgi:hypothetical protein